MRIDIMNEMDRAILELALVDSFCDMFFYEDEEFIEKTKEYLNSLETGKNTEEQDATFFEKAGPYIDNSIMIYSGQRLIESQAEKVVGADSFDKSSVPVDTTNQMGEAAREAAKKKLLVKPAKKLTEQEEIFGQIIFESLKTSLDITKAKINKVGKSLADATAVGIITAKKRFQENLHNQPNRKKVALVAPEDKK